MFVCGPPSAGAPLSAARGCLGAAPGCGVMVLDKIQTAQTKIQMVVLPWSAATLGAAAGTSAGLTPL